MILYTNINIIINIKYKLSVILLLFLLHDNIAQLRIYPKSLILLTQYDVDTFQNKYDVINGRLYVGSLDSNKHSNITDISKLLGIKAIWGDLDVKYNKKLKNLYGLDSILVAGYLGVNIENNDSLEDVSALDNWQKFTDNDKHDLIIWDNPLLTSISFKSVEKLALFWIWRNKSLYKIDGFNKLQFAKNLDIDRCFIDTISGFDICNSLHGLIHNSKIKSFEGLKNVKSISLEINNCDIDSIVGGDNTFIENLTIKNCNTKYINFGKDNGSLQYSNLLYKGLKTKGELVVFNCPNLEKIKRPANNSHNIYCQVTSCPKLDSLDFDSATLLNVVVDTCPKLIHIGMPIVDTLSFELGTSYVYKVPNYYNASEDLTAPNATLLYACRAYGPNMKGSYFPKVKRAHGVSIGGESFNFHYFPELVESLWDTINGRNQRTGGIYFEAYTNELPDPKYGTKIFIPKFEWGSFGFRLKNTPVDVSRVPEINFMYFEDWDSTSIIKFNPNLKVNKYNFMVDINGDTNFIYYYRRLSLINFNKGNLPIFNKFNEFESIRLSFNKRQLPDKILPNVHKLSEVNIFGNEFKNLNFLDSVQFIVKSFNRVFYIENNKTLSLCNSVCTILNNWKKDSTQNSFLIENNAPGCNSIAEILASCSVSTTDPQYNNINYIQVYPNPANSGNTIQIPLTEYSNIQYELFNIAGVRVYQYMGNGYTNSILLPQLPAGMYVLKCTQRNNIYVGKVIVE